MLLISLLVVTLGAETLVRGASLLALRVGVSPLFVGLTIVGFGTSSPELSASLAATLQGASGVSVGNVVGSNIFNIVVILGGLPPHPGRSESSSPRSVETSLSLWALRRSHGSPWRSAATRRS